MDKFLQVLGVQGAHKTLVVEATTPQPEGADAEETPMPDWGKIVELCDLANLNHENCKDILKDLKKRVGNADWKVQYLSLVMLESLIKNGGCKLHVEVAATEDVLREIGRIGIRSEENEAVMQARRLILSMALFCQGKKELRNFGRIAPQTVLDEYKKTVITDDWRTVTGPGSAGVREDPKSYQEISPRAPPETHVVRSSDKRQPTEEPLRARVDPATVSPRKRLPPEIQELWDQLNSLKSALLSAEHEGRSVRNDPALSELADEVRKSKDAVAQAANMSTNTTTLNQLLELSDGINPVLGLYSRLCEEREGEAAGLSNSSSDRDMNDADLAVDAEQVSCTPPATAAPVAKLDLDQVLSAPSATATSSSYVPIDISATAQEAPPPDCLFDEPDNLVSYHEPAETGNIN